MSFKSKHTVKNWQLLADGEQQGLYECFDVFYDDLYRFGLSLYKNPELVKESINNLFIELWKIKDKLSAVKNIQQYVLTIYKRVLYKTYINNTCGMPFDGLDQETIEAGLTEQSYETILIASQHDEHLKKRLQQALSQLSPRQKEIIRLRYFEQTSIEGIAELTGLTERTIYNTMYNAIKVLKEVFAFLVVYNIHIK
ncbi:MAG: sigma-70 family RNA polymerase sigma factor [Bacteroidota bacterium]|nr:sigma-70 family RNA polymerase sigma factor [Bacteroidota bacterium]